jgi:hypothetical protein
MPEETDDRNPWVDKGRENPVILAGDLNTGTDTSPTSVSKVITNRLKDPDKWVKTRLFGKLVWPMWTSSKLGLRSKAVVSTSKTRSARDINPPDSKRFTSRMRMLRRKYSRNKLELEF